MDPFIAFPRAQKLYPPYILASCSRIALLPKKIRRHCTPVPNFHLLPCLWQISHDLQLRCTLPNLLPPLEHMRIETRVGRRNERNIGSLKQAL